MRLLLSLRRPVWDRIVTIIIIFTIMITVTWAVGAMTIVLRSLGGGGGAARGAVVKVCFSNSSVLALYSC